MTDTNTTTATPVTSTGEATIFTPFSGSPKLYRRIAIWGSVGIHLYVFVGYWAIKAFLAGEKWPTDWFPATIALVSCILFARMSYRWIMRLDAQYGRGGGWDLVPTQVKLPWEKPRRKT